MSKTDQIIKQFVEEKVKRIEDAIFSALKDIAEDFIINARTMRTYKDQTSNLRGSTGYVILKDGVEVFGGFIFDKEEGQQAGRDLIASIKGEHSRGYSLIMMAGMSYAIYVESQGFSVITGASQIAEQDFINMIEKLRKKINSKQFLGV